VGKLFSFFYHLVMSFRKLFLPALIGNVESELKPVDEEGPVPNRSTGARWLNEVEVIGTKQAIEPGDLGPEQQGVWGEVFCLITSDRSPYVLLSSRLRPSAHDPHKDPRRVAVRGQGDAMNTGHGA
jgi:hypothetical protein